MNEEQLENPVLGYVVIAAALVVGMLSATVFGQTPSRTTGLERNRETLVDVATSSSVRRKSVQDHSKVTSQETHPLRQSSAANNTTGSTRRWILGVRSTATFTGCVVTSIVSGSPADEMGLEVGDRIVTVNAQQVGWIGEKLVPLDQAIDESPSRHARFLVERGRSRTIRSLQTSLSTVDESLGL